MTTSIVRDSSRAARRVAFAGALGVHAGVLAMVLLWPTGEAPAPPVAPLEVSIVVDEAPRPAPAARENPEEPTERPAHPVPVAAATPHSEAIIALPATPAESSSALPMPAPSPETAWAPSWTLPREIDLGLDGGLAMRTAIHPDHPAGATPEGAEPPDPGHLRALLDNADLERGFGASGPVISAVHDLPTSAFGAGDGVANFEIVTDAQGHVTSVRVLDATSDPAEWSATARTLQETLRSRTLPIPSGARGVALVLRVDVADRLPSGAPAGKGARGIANSDGIGAGFDLSDIGAHSHRVVHPRLVSERRL